MFPIDPFNALTCSDPMPLWRGQPYSPSVSTLGLANDVEVLLLRFTGEIFTDFECAHWPL